MKKKEPPESPPQELEDLASEFATKLGVVKPKLVVIENPEILHDPIACQTGGVVTVEPNRLEEFTDGEIRWFMAHAVATSAIAPPMPLNGGPAEHALLLCVLPLILCGAVMGSFLYLILGFAIVAIVFVIYFRHVSIRQKKRDAEALAAAKSVTDDEASMESAMAKRAIYLQGYI